MRRRDFLAGAAGLAAIGATGTRARAAAEAEVIEITPALISQAQSEGRLLLRHTAQLDEVNGMVSAFEARFGIKVQLDRKVGVVATQVFATEERAGQHLMDVIFGADPAETTKSSRRKVCICGLRSLISHPSSIPALISPISAIALVGPMS